LLRRLGLYRLDQQLAQDGATTFLGAVETTNRPVMIHVINSGERGTLEALFNRLKNAGSSGMIDFQTEGDSVYAITEVISGFKGFSTWLGQTADDSHPSSGTAAGQNPDTIDRLIGSFEAPVAAEKPPSSREPKDEVADLFARPESATQMRGQKASHNRSVPGKRSYEPPSPPKPGPYTVAIEGRRSVNVEPPSPLAMPGPEPANPSPNTGQADAALLQRVTHLEAELAKWRLCTIATMAASLVILIVMFGLIVRVK
jgi:hypothetical protein